MIRKALLWLVILNGSGLLAGLIFQSQLPFILVLTITINLIFIFNIQSDLRKENDRMVLKLNTANTQQVKNLQVKSVQLETIVINLPFPMALIDAQGNIALSNTLFQQFSIAPLGPIVFESKQLVPEIRSFVRNSYISEEVARKTLNINQIDYQAISVPIYDKTIYSGCLVMFLDVTQILEGERFQKRFIADASHELKTPLSSITGMIQILNRPDFNDEDTRIEFCRQIEHEALRMDEIIQDLLTLSKLTSKQILLELGKYKLLHLVKEAYAPLKQSFKEKNLAFNVDIDPQIELNVDREKFHQIISNLLINALKFTEQGSISVKAHIQEPYCILSVQDTGIGIKKEDQKYIFERFYRSDQSRSRQSGGSGLGLAIVKTYLSAHKAEIEVSSEINQGSTFTIKIPLVR